MSTGLLLCAPAFRATDTEGAPIAGAQLMFTLTGTTSPAAVYGAATLVAPLSNPVTADAGGLFPPIFLDPAVCYRARLMDASGVLIQDIDPVYSPPATAAGSVSAQQLASGAAAANLGFTPLNRAGDTASNLRIGTPAAAADAVGYLGLPVTQQDGAYALSAADIGRLVRANVSSPVTWTLNAGAAPVGACLAVRNAATSTGALSLVRGAGVTLFGAGGTVSRDWVLAAGGLVSLVQEAADVWIVAGSGLS